MHFRFASIVAICLTVCLSGARAQPASTAPASTAPASTAPAGHDAKAALKAYNAAMRAGDIEAMVALQHTTADDQARFAKTIARADAHVAKLLVAAQERFGGDAQVRVGQAIHDASDADIDAAAIELDGERVNIHFHSGGSAPMRQVNGKWKCDTGSLLGEFKNNVEAGIDHFSKRGNFAKVTAQDIAAGKYKTLDELLDRIGKHERELDNTVPN